MITNHAKQLNKKKDKQLENQYTVTKSKSDEAQWEDEQLDIFSDIIIAILLKENLSHTKDES